MQTSSNLGIFLVLTFCTEQKNFCHFYSHKTLPYITSSNVFFFCYKGSIIGVPSASLQKECKLCLVYFKFLVAAKVYSSVYLQKVPLLYLRGRENATYLIPYVYKVPSYLQLPQQATAHLSVQLLFLLTFSSAHICFPQVRNLKG